MARLDELIAFNQRSAPVPPDAKSSSVEARRSLCIVTCVDPRLTRFFSSVLGIDRGDAVLIRIPGANLLGGHADALRAVAAAVYINQATEVLILGHTDCGTTRIDASAIASRMQSEGLAAQTMPGGPREFLGGVGDIRSALRASAAAVRAAPFLPRTLLVHSAILDIQTGVLEVLERGENVQPVGTIDGSLTYRPGPGGLPANPLGDGLLLLASTSHTLFSDLNALAFSADALATPSSMASNLPPGWADGAVALSPVAISSGGSTLDGVGDVEQIASTINLGFKPVDLTPGVQINVGAFSAAPKAVPTPASPPPLPPRTAPSSAHKHRPSPRARVADVEVIEVEERPRKSASPRGRDPGAQANLDRVRDFYRVEFPLERRKQVMRSLTSALSTEQPTEQLLKIILKPILESGQKRYKVIDEMIAVKGLVAPLPPAEAYAVLSQLLE